jgi:hypothetical protein
MASRSRKGGGGRGAKVIWAFVILALVVAFFQIPYNPGAKGIIEVVASKSDTVKVWVGGIAPGVADFINNIIRGGGSAPTIGGGSTPPVDNGTSNGTGEGSSTSPNSTEASTELGALTVAAAVNASYDRNDWKQWTNVRPCWNTRDEVLAVEAEQGSLVLQDKDNKVTTDINKACKIISGKWKDPYTDAVITNPSQLDIDHTVPLSYANQHGASSWDKTKKEQYANDLTYPGHLIATSAKANRSKGDKGPGDWKPENKSSWCAYAVDWVTISTTYKLSITKSDKSSLTEMLATCK